MPAAFRLEPSTKIVDATESRNERDPGLTRWLFGRWTGRSQAVRLPKEFRFDTDMVLVRREGNSVILEPLREWPEGYAESFAGVPDDFERPGTFRRDDDAAALTST